MTTTTSLSHHRAANGGHREYGLRTVTKMEWHRLWTIRSTWYIVVIFAVGMVGLAMLVLGHEGYAQMSATDRKSFDPTNDGFIGLLLGQLLFGVLGALAITSEFSSGMIRVSVAAVPKRSLLLGAKASAVGIAALVIGELSAFAAYFAGQAMLQAPAPHATLGQPGVLRALLMGGAYPALIALVGLGLGAVVRHTAGAVCAVVCVLFVIPLLLLPLGASVQHSVVRYLPEQIAVDSLTAVKPTALTLPPAEAFGLLCLYAAALLAAGTWSLTRRDV